MLELGTIILDTVCLSESAGRKTPRDEAIIAKLQALRPSLDRRQIFDDLLAIKHNDTASTVMLLLFLFFLALYTFNVLVTVLWLYSVCIAEDIFMLSAIRLNVLIINCSLYFGCFGYLVF